DPAAADAAEADRVRHAAGDGHQPAFVVPAVPDRGGGGVAAGHAAGGGAGGTVGLRGLVVASRGAAGALAGVRLPLAAGGAGAGRGPGRLPGQHPLGHLVGAAILTAGVAGPGVTGGAPSERSTGLILRYQECQERQERHFLL